MTSWAKIDVEDSVAREGLKVIGEPASVSAAWQARNDRSGRLPGAFVVSLSAISRLETGTIQGMRLVTLSRIVGLIRRSSAYDLPDGPPPPTRRLPGERRS